MGLFSSKKSTVVDQTSNITDINTDNRAARDSAIIGGEGDISVTVTDAGLIKSAENNLAESLDFARDAVSGIGGRTLKTVDRTVDQGFDVANNAIFSSATLADRFGERNTDLVNQTLGRESLLTSQVLSNLGSVFQNTVGDIRGGAQAQLETITGALNDTTALSDVTKRTGIAGKVILYGAIAAALAYGGPKLIAAFKGK